MRYEMMLPHQIRTAIDGNWPVVLPLGVPESEPQPTDSLRERDEAEPTVDVVERAPA